MSSASGTTLQRSSSSSSSSNEPMGGSDYTGSHVPQREVGPATARNILSNRRVSEVKKCQVTGFVNFVEAQPSVGRFKVDDQDPRVHMTARSPPRIKITDVLVPTIAPECNYGVFHPGGVAERDPALATTRDDDLRG